MGKNLNASGFDNITEYDLKDLSEVSLHFDVANTIVLTQNGYEPRGEGERKLDLPGRILLLIYKRRFLPFI